MKFLLTLGACFFLVFGAFLTPTFALTDGQCVCYCKTEDGAIYQGEKGSVALCSSSCRAEEEKMLGCYSDLSMSPEFSRLCYSKSECEADTETDRQGREIASVWGGQADTCLPGKGYCYAPQGAGKYAVELAVPIAGLTEVGDIGTYIVAIYRWLVGLGAFICVVVFTIAGFMWLMSAGNASQVERAKELMTNTILGMILLLSAVAIGTLIDPRTMEIGALRTPKLAPVAFITTDDCDEWKRLGIEISQVSGSGMCGDTGIATNVDAVAKNKQVSIRVNDLCKFRNCSNSFEYCTRDTDADSGYSCKRCSDIYNVSFGAGTGVVQSASDALGVDYPVQPEQCAQIEASSTADRNRGRESGNYQFCRFFAPNVASSASQTRGCYEFTYPDTVNDYSLDCDILRQDAEASGGVSCRIYDEVYAHTGSILNAIGYHVDDLAGANSNYPLLEGLCSADPCGFAPPGETCDTFIPGIDYASDFCTQFGIALPFCSTAIINASRADCVNSGFIRTAKAIESAVSSTQGSDPGFLDQLTSEIAGVGASYQYLQVLDVDGKPTDYQSEW